MTIVSPPPHLAFVHKRLPIWLAKATPGQRNRLKKLILRSHAASRRVADALAPVQDIEAYCRPLLEQALKRWYPDTALPRVDQGRVRQQQRDMSWLEAAMQNFAANATPRLFERPGSAQPCSLDVHTFVSGVRNLDLGRLYRYHLGDHIDTDRFRELLREQDRAAFAATLATAALQGHVDSHGLAMGETVASGLAPSARRTLRCHFLSLFNLPLNGPLLIHLDEAHGSGNCLLYLPGHPTQPLRQYASEQAAGSALTQLLWTQDGRTFFTRFVNLADQPTFAARLRATLYPRYPYATLHPVPPTLEKGQSFNWIKRVFPAPTDIWQETLDKNARLPLVATRWKQDVFAERARTHVERKLQDAATLAVPVSQRDAAAQLARLEHWLGIGLNLLNVAGLFVPGLGEMMMVIGGGQLVDEFLDGVHSANEGDGAAAIGALFDVFGNLALMAALGTASHFSETPGTLEQWHQVGEPGNERWWHGELAAFSRPRPWPSTHKIDAQGLFQWHGQSWLERDGLALPLEHAAEGTQRLAPARGVRHQPRLVGNGQGTWLLEHDRPLAWEQTQLLEHLGAAASGLDLPSLERALRCSGYDANVLRKVLQDHRPLPALLLDCLELSGATPRTTLSEPTEAAALARAFPSLSPAARLEILTQARPPDILQLRRTGRLPLRMAETARLYIRESRISKALARFHSAGAGANDRDALALGALRRLPGWSGNVRIALREGRLAGHLLGEAGNSGMPGKTLVRVADTYQPFDEHGNSLANASDLFDAILQALPDSERRAMSLNIGEAPALREKLFEKAAGNRRQAARDLGMAPVRPMYRLPSRLPGDSRIGYRLSGNAQGWLSEDQMFDQLYPATPTDDRQMLRLRLRFQAGQQPGAFRRLLTRLWEEYLRLDFALQRWVHDPQGIAVGGLELRSANREALAQRIRAAWRREPGEDPAASIDHVPLLLEAHQADSLPRLPVNMPYVRRVTINGLTDPHASNLNEVLGAFPGVRHLDIAGNALNRLPPVLGQLSELQSLDLAENNIDLLDEASLAVFDQLPHLLNLNLTEALQTLPVEALDRLARLPALQWLQADLNELSLTAEHFLALQRWPSLRGLSLGRNAIVLDESSRAALAGLNRLELLILYENPLTLAPDLSGWNALQNLDLQDCGISQWPDGLLDLMNRQPLTLRQIDLSDNALTQVPELRDLAYTQAIREHQAQFAYSFDNNPLDDIARARLSEAGLQVHDSARSSGDWAIGDSPELLAQLAGTAQDPQWRALHDLFLRLSGSADYQRNPEAMLQRMRHVLRVLVVGEQEEAASGWGRAQLKQQIDDLLEDAGQQCVDQASLLFQQVETDVQVWQAVNHASPDMADQQVAASVVGCLFRQRLLDAQIGELYNARVSRRRALAAARDETERQAAPPTDGDDDISDGALTEPDYLLDELEMALYARLRLRTQLNLPPQPQEIRFGYLARLSDATLHRLGARVNAGATATNLADWAAGQSFWQAWVRRLTPQPFAALARAWEGASEYYDALSTIGGTLGDYTGPPVPEAFIQALESETRDVPGLTWRRNGKLQRFDLQAPRFAALQPSLHDRVGGILLHARQAAETHLSRTQTDQLINAHLPPANTTR
ncbi:dermonecrotic toxin domain-containing protein [Pseudomonas sp. microsymbiont 2]